MTNKNCMTLSLTICPLGVIPAKAGIHSSR